MPYNAYRLVLDCCLLYQRSFAWILLFLSLSVTPTNHLHVQLEYFASVLHSNFFCSFPQDHGSTAATSTHVMVFGFGGAGCSCAPPALALLCSQL